MNRWTAAVLQLFALTLVSLVSLTGPGAMAQSYPSKPIRLVVGFPAGSTTDVVARVLAAGLQNTLKQSVVVENRPGASSMIAATNVAAAPADGYTLLFATLPTLSTGTLNEKLPIDPINDFTPVAQVLGAQFMLAGSADLPASTLVEFINLLKAAPAKYQYGSSGNGSTIHLSAELFNRGIGVDVLHVPYKGTSEAVQDLLGKKINYAFIGLENLQHVRSGALKGFAVSGAKRDPVAPELPTISEALPGFTAATTMLVFGPKALPRAITDTLNQAINRVLVSDEFVQKAKALGGLIIATNSTPDSTRTFVRDEINRWDAIVKASKLKN